MMKASVAVLLLCMFFAVLFYAAGGTTLSNDGQSPANPPSGMVSGLNAGAVAPTPVQPTPVQPVSAPPKHASVTYVDVDATDYLGRQVTLPGAGTYEVSVESGFYSTGTHQRTVVAVFVDPPAQITGCGPYNEPCLRPGDFYVGSWDSPAPGSPVVKTLDSTALRVIAIDDMGSYNHMNSGSVRIVFREIR